MGSLKHQMLRIVQHAALASGEAAPEQEDHRPVHFIHGTDDGIRELLPALVLVGCSGMGPDGEYGVQQEYALFGPGSETAVIRDLEPHIVMQLLVDILQGGWDIHPFLYREAEPVSLPRFVIGILTDDHHLHPGKGRQMQGVEDVLCRRIDHPLGIFSVNEFI